MNLNQNRFLLSNANATQHTGQHAVDAQHSLSPATDALINSSPLTKASRASAIARCSRHIDTR
jgi:hypothetical protein